MTVRFGRRPVAQRLGQLQHRHRSRRVIVGAVEDRVGVGGPLAGRTAAQMIEMGGEEDDLRCPGLVASGDLAGGIPGVADLDRLHLRRQRHACAAAERAERGVRGFVEHDHRRARRGRESLELRAQRRQPGAGGVPPPADLRGLRHQNRRRAGNHGLVFAGIGSGISTIAPAGMAAPGRELHERSGGR